MARYRNEDNVCMMFDRFFNMCQTKEQKTLVLDMKQAFLEIKTADVVPKSEVARDIFKRIHNKFDYFKRYREVNDIIDNFFTLIEEVEKKMF